MSDAKGLPHASPSQSHQPIQPTQQPSQQVNQPIQQQVRSFDTITALAGLYLWLLFGFFTSLLGCDLQRLMTNNIYVKHLMAFIAFFFLMSVVDTNNNVGILKTWLKTFIVYLIFMVSIKCKIIPAAIIILLLVLDQNIKIQMTYEQNNNIMKNIKTYTIIRNIIYFSIIAVAVIGFILYFIRQYNEFGSEFSPLIFFFGSNKCNDL